MNAQTEPEHLAAAEDVPKTPRVPRVDVHVPFGPPLNTLSLADPWRWLAAGWHDFRRAQAIGLFFGL